MKSENKAQASAGCECSLLPEYVRPRERLSCGAAKPQDPRPDRPSALVWNRRLGSPRVPLCVLMCIIFFYFVSLFCFCLLPIARLTPAAHLCRQFSNVLNEVRLRSDDRGTHDGSTCFIPFSLLIFREKVTPEEDRLAFIASANDFFTICAPLNARSRTKTPHANVARSRIPTKNSLLQFSFTSTTTRLSYDSIHDRFLRSFFFSFSCFFAHSQP